MRKTITIVVAVAFFAITGCSSITNVMKIVDLLCPDRTPVCDQDSCGTVLNGKVCVFSDGTYRWKGLE